MNVVLHHRELPGGRSIAVVKGDITREKTDAIVNAANSYLRHGGGVAGAIVRRGGRIIQKESDRIGYLPVGEAATTVSGRLPCRKIIHTVGPRWGEGEEAVKLRRAVKSSLRLAHDLNFESLSMPAISSGIFGFPKDKCAEILFSTVLEFFKEHPESSIKKVRFCNIDRDTCSYFATEFRRRFKEEKD
jgi:O-acetyl-ADP-ribose deacetylase (regulator of RNase III)